MSTGKVIEKAMPVDMTAVGTAEALSTVQIHSQVTGQLNEIRFVEGEQVDKGQPLFTIDPQPFQLALDQAEAVLARDTAQAQNANAEVSRYKPLLDRGLIPHEQFDAVTANAAALGATTGSDRAAVDIAKLNLKYTQIVSPMSGRAGAFMVHPGDLIRANDAAPMVTINQIAPIDVSFAVTGRMLDDIRRYQARAPLKVEATIPGSAQTRVEGRVAFIDNAVDPASGTVRLKAVFSNADRALWPGLYVDVSLQLSSDPHALVAPSAAVEASQQGQYVYVVKDDQTVEMRPVQVSRAIGEESVIAGGLKNGETVVTDGQLRLTPGVRVVIRPPVFTGATR